MIKKIDHIGIAVRSLSDSLDTYRRLYGLDAIKIETLTGRRPKYYRPATGHSDEICVEMANALGYEVVNFSLSGDAGATFKKSQVKEALLNVPPSSIILLHMNRPEGGTAEGVMEAIPEFKKRGIGFVKLSDTSLR